jgi:hypothetical protein
LGGIYLRNLILTKVTMSVIEIIKNYIVMIWRAIPKFFDTLDVIDFLPHGPPDPPDEEPEEGEKPEPTPPEEPKRGWFGRIFKRK